MALSNTDQFRNALENTIIVFVLGILENAGPVFLPPIIKKLILSVEYLVILIRDGNITCWELGIVLEMWWHWWFSRGSTGMACSKLFL